MNMLQIVKLSVQDIHTSVRRKHFKIKCKLFACWKSHNAAVFINIGDHNCTHDFGIIFFTLF